MKLDIINIDNLKKVKGKKRYRNKHPLLPQHPFNMLIVGQTGCGKTNMLLNLILKFSSFDRLYIFSKHLHQPKMVLLNDIFDKVKEKTDEDILFMSNTLDDLPPVDEMDSELQNLIIFDDMICEPNLTPVVDYFIRGRHSNCSSIFLSQIYTKIPRQIRLNTHYFCFFNTPNRLEINIINNDCNYELEKDDFKNRFKKAVSKKYDFFFIDTKTTNPALKYRKNFNYVEEKDISGNL